MKPLIISFLALSISACTWVTLSEKGQHVRIASDEEIKNCLKVGQVTAKTRATLLLKAKRNAEKIALELSVLARNEASKLSADTIVAQHTPNDNGEQRFNAYRCL